MIHLYFDMDGVLAKWRENCTYEMTWEKGYFYNLELEEKVKETINLLKGKGFDVRILSAAYMNGVAEVEKAKWLKKHNLGDIDAIFMPCGKNKADFVKTDGVNVLIDDYNHNLIAWESSDAKEKKFVAIKFLNGLNGNSNEWSGRTISRMSSPEILAKSIEDFAKGIHW